MKKKYDTLVLCQIVIGPQFLNFLLYVAFYLGAGSQKMLTGTLKWSSLNFLKSKNKEKLKNQFAHFGGLTFF